EASLYAPEPKHLELIEQAVERALRRGDIEGAARARYWLGWFFYAFGDQVPAVEHYAEALRMAETVRDERLVAQLTVNLGQSLAAAGDYAEALRELDRGLELKQRFESDRAGRHPARRRPRLGFAYALSCKGLLLGDLGRFTDAYRCFDEALGTLEGSSHATEGSCLALLGMVRLFQGDWLGALETAAKARATAERVTGPYVYAMSRTVGGYARFMLERRRDALDEPLHALKWMEERGTKLYISLNYAYLADALEVAGDAERATRYAHLAIERAELRDRMGEALAYRTLARTSARAGRPEQETASYLAKALRSALARGSARELALTELTASSLRVPAPRAEPESGDAPPASGLQQRFHDMGMYAFESVARGLMGSP
ncbi:MAG TPA: hypothetical protein VGQ57_02895, partial [Polyangiaceae bacterium]|nr:hypothetical protein [Polyangiaceae bacterium]